MPEVSITQVAGAVSTVATCVALVTSGLMSITQASRMKGHIAAFVIQKWYRNIKRRRYEQARGKEFKQTLEEIKEYKECRRIEEVTKYGKECRPRRNKLIMKFHRSYSEMIEKEEETSIPEATKSSKPRLSDAFRSKRLSLSSYLPKNWRERKRREMCPTCSREPPIDQIDVSETIEVVSPPIVAYPSWYGRRRASTCPVCCWKLKRYRKTIISMRIQDETSIFSIVPPCLHTDGFSQPSAQTFKRCLGLVSENVKREHSARLIQRWYRCIKKGWLLSTVTGLNTPLKQRQEVIYDLMKHGATVLVQRWYRYHRKRRYMLHYVHLHACAYYIQLWLEQQWLRWHMLHYVHVCAVAVAIQKWFRRMKKISHMKHYVYLCDKANLIKRWGRTQKVRRKIEIYAKRKAAVMKIEGWWIRRHKIAIIEAYVLLTNIAVKIQRYLRNYLRAKYIIEYSKKYRASVVLQRGFKSFLRVQAIDRYIYFYDQASLIQKWYRRMRKRKYVLHYLHLYACARVIQLWYRKNVKIRYMLHYIHLNSAATAIQRWYIDHLVKMKIMHYAHALAAANAIKHWYTICTKRRKLNRYLAFNSRGVILEDYKDYCKISAVNYLQRRYKSRILQKWYNNKEKRKFILDYIKTDAAAIKIQRWYRNQRTRRKILSYLKELCVACRIQRRYFACQKWREATKMIIDDLRKQRAKKAIQKERIKQRARRTLRQRYVEVDAAARAVQKGCRGWQGTKKALSSASRSFHNWYHSIDEEKMMRDYHEQRIRKLRMRRMCDACTTKKLFRVASKVRIASKIFVNENSIVIVQRWWRKMRFANSLLKRAQLIKASSDKISLP